MARWFGEGGAFGDQVEDSVQEAVRISGDDDACHILNPVPRPGSPI